MLTTANGCREVALALAFLFPSTSLIADGTPVRTTSMVYGLGETSQVNGSKVSASIALSDGDILKAGSATLSIVRQGSTIAVRANSTLAIMKNALYLGCGDAVVGTMNGMSTLSPDYGITPTGKKIRYEVIQGRENVKVISLEGDTRVSVRGETFAVHSGQMLTFPGRCLDDAALRSAANQSSSNGTDSQTTSNRTDSQTTSNPTVVAPGKLSGTSTIILTSVGAGAIAEIVSWYRTVCCVNKKPVSPSAP